MYFVISIEHIIFWTAIFLLVYTHAGYPFLLWGWSKLRPYKTHTATFEPLVSVVVVAYNESARIQKRIENLLAQDYPGHRLNIVIASDGSDDDTVLLAQQYQLSGVTVIAFNRRRGKSAVLNDVIPVCRGDTVVMADSRQRFESGAIRVLAAHFADPEVGAVSGELILTGDKESTGVGEGVGLYWKYEKFIRLTESRIDSTIGATGAIYAIRRKLFEPIPVDTLLDDVTIPVRIVRRGYRVLFEPRARAYDHVTTTMHVEFMRKVRTLAGNFQLFVQDPWLLNPFANRLWMQTVSHKVLRLLAPAILLAAFIANLLLLHEPLYRWTFSVQLALYGAAYMGFRLRNSKRHVRFLKIPYVFCMLNWAVVVGLVRFIYGRQRVTWETAPQEPAVKSRHFTTSTPLRPESLTATRQQQWGNSRIPAEFERRLVPRTTSTSPERKPS
jgi:cellulose synthase/poly-beta-1,6-N-acetylglucosamine synthase-like glycosyltransferase